MKNCTQKIVFMSHDDPYKVFSEDIVDDIYVYVYDSAITSLKIWRDQIQQEIYAYMYHKCGGIDETRRQRTT